MRIREQRKQLVQRRSALLNAESSRVITRPHIPGDSARITALIDRVSNLIDEDVKHLLEAVIQDFSGRHRNFRETLQKNFDRIAEHAPKSVSLSSEKQLLLGAYFTAEYSVEAAAFFNPSIVPHPDQKGVPKGSQRFVMSFRATGEGHVSSIEFRSDLDAQQTQRYQAANDYAARYCRGLRERLVHDDRAVLAELRQFFRMQLNDKISHIHRRAWAPTGTR